MHVLGKVGVWLVVIAAMAATWLTGTFINRRDGLTKKYVAARDEVRKLKPQLIEKQAELNAKEAERFRALELWGTSEGPVQTQVQPNGVVVVDLGTAQKISEGMIIYGFEIQADNSAIYRGDFLVLAARDNQSQLQPNWVARPEDVATWKAGMWRWRSQIPAGFQSNYDQQIHLINAGAVALADRRRSASIQDDLLSQARSQLEMREAELVGGDQLTKDEALDIEFREGLVAAIEQTEESRNQVLTKVDELRRQLRTVQSEVDRIKQQNVELSKKLPN